jgi:hypothetical protein
MRCVAGMFSWALAMKWMWLWAWLLALEASADAPPAGLVPFALDLDSGWTAVPYNLAQGVWITHEYKVESSIGFRVIFSDAYCPGEMVSLYVNGTFLRNSSSVPASSTCDPRVVSPVQARLGYPEAYSHLAFDLPPGNHSLAMKLIQVNSAYPQGSMYLRAYGNSTQSCE